MRYKLGILGGMGPLATATLYQRIIEHTKATKDQDHIEMCILSNSKIPDRTDAIINGKESPVSALNEGIATLIKVGCEYFIIPCNTAHYFKDQFINQGLITFIDMIDETNKHLYENYKDSSICILCTSGTKDSNVYTKDNKYDLNVIYPDELNQNKVMEVIINTKAGLDELNHLQSIIDNIEADVFVLACTELSIYNNRLNQRKKIVDAMNVLIHSTIEKCGYEYKK